MAETDDLDSFNNDVIRGKTMKSIGFVLNEFSWIENIEPKPTTNIGTKGLNNLEMSSLSTIRLLPQCFSTNDVITKRVLNVLQH